MAKVSSSGPTEDATRAIMSTTKRRAKVPSSGPMAGNAKAAGKVANSMVKQSTPPQLETKDLDGGKMAKDVSG